VTAAPLAGALDTLALADVLQLLDLGRKSGVLAVDAGDGVRRGLLRLRGGAVCAARFRDADARELRDPYDAVAAMLALAAGRFTFAPDPPDAPTAGPAGVRVEALLMEALRRADERAAPRPAERVPVLAAGPDAGPDAGGADAPLALRAADWALLAAVDGRRTVAAVAAAAGQAPERAAAALDALARAGLVAFRDDVAPAPARSSTR
jgi:hypothetical protein